MVREVVTDGMMVAGGESLGLKAAEPSIIQPVYVKPGIAMGFSVYAELCGHNIVLSGDSWVPDIF